MKKLISMLLSTFVVLSMFVFSASSVSADQTSDVQDFVTRLYSVCLDRTPDQGGLNDWSNKLINHEATGCSAAYGFIFSNEFQSKNCTNEQYVTYMYSAFFGRTPDQAGLNDWVSRLDGGATRESVFCGFANSVEFGDLCSRYGIVRGFHIEGQNYNQVAMVNLFVDRLYNVVLNRTCDNGGMADWTNQLVNHTNSGCGVAYGFVFSPEFKAKNLCNEHYVDTLYMAFMGRTADTAGKNAWVAQLDSGVSREAVFNGFAGSQEFMGICSSYGIESGSINLTGEGTYANGGTCALCASGHIDSGAGNGNGTTTAPTQAPANRPSATPVPTSRPTTVPTATVTPTATPTATPTPTGVPHATTPGVPSGFSVDPNRNGIHKYGNDWYYFQNGVVDPNFVGFQEIDGNTYYIRFAKNYVYPTILHGTILRMTNGKIYYFNDDGIMTFGPHLGYLFLEDGSTYNHQWVKYDNKWYYVDSGNYVYFYCDRWVKIDGKYYYFDHDYAWVKKTGWQEISGKWYYLNSDGSIYTGWLNVGSDTYYLDENGQYQTGFVDIDGKTYYFHDSGKLLQANHWIEVSYYWYYAGSDNTITTGWKKINDKWYHFDSSGRMATGGKTINGEFYYFGDDGVMFTGWMRPGLSANFGASYFDTDGRLVHNTWKQIDGKWYYFDDLRLVTDSYVEGYWVDSDGVQSTGWVMFNKYSPYGYQYWIYIDPVTNKKTVGWKKIDGKWYYFDEDDGRMNTGWKNIDFEWYYFGDDGYARTGFVDIDEKTYFFDPVTCAAPRGFFQYEGNWYYAMQETSRAGRVFRNGYVQGYYVGADGIVQGYHG